MRIKKELFLILPALFFLGSCEKNPVDRLTNPVPEGDVSGTTRTYTLFDDRVKTGGGLGFIPSGENQSIDMIDASEPRRSINQIRYTWNGQTVPQNGVPQHAFAGFSFTITPDFSTFDSAQPKNLNANNAGYSKLTFFIRGSLSRDNYVRIEGPDNDNGGAKKRESTPYGNTNPGNLPFTLTNEWQPITLDLIPSSDFDLVKTYFTVSIQFVQPLGTTAAGNGGTIYLDDIRFE